MLTDTAIRALKPGAKEFKKSDTGGLHLLIKPSGAKLWRLAYRFDKKQKTLVGGRYPFVGLADARAWRDSACVSASKRTPAAQLLTTLISQ